MISGVSSLDTFLSRVYVPSRLELSVGAIEQIEVAIRLFERWAGRTLGVYDLTEDLIRQFLVDYRKTHAAATTNSKRRHLLGLWECAYQEAILDRPPRRARVRQAKEHPAIPEAFTLAEVGRILAAADAWPRAVAGIPAGDWLGSILRVVYDTGERRGAVLAVEAVDLDLRTGAVVFRKTKTGRERWCRLHPDTVAACLRIFDPAGRLVWPWPYCRRAFDRLCSRLLVKAEVQRRRKGLFQTLRRTSGTLVEANGGDGAKHLGNSRAVFERHYRDPRFFSSDLDRLPRPK